MKTRVPKQITKKKQIEYAINMFLAKVQYKEFICKSKD